MGEGETIFDDLPKFVFLTGKGGVGKTSLACPTAVNLADSGRTVLLVNTDPASNVGPVFGQEIGNAITPIAAVTNESALEIDPEAAAQDYRDRILGPVRGSLPESVPKGMEEQLSGAFTTEIAAFDEFTVHLTEDAVTERFDHFILDTAPTGHTIRLLQLPGAWSGFLEEGKGDASCLGPLAGLEKQRARYAAAVESLSDAHLAAMPQSRFELRQKNLVGLEALRRMAQPVDLQPAASADALPDLPPLGRLIDDLERPGKGLIMTMDKGGVGKTTTAAAVVVELAARGHNVPLTTTDPAAHLTETLAGDVENLTVSRIDPEVETQAYRDHIMATRGKSLDAQGRAMLEEDLRSPCTEEIAVFQAFSRTIREASKRFVVTDTAPPGHTLLLLDATGSYHRETLRHAGEGAARMTTPMMRLQDPEQTKILVVTLPETTPVLEAARLHEDLGRAGITPFGWVINSSLAAAGTTHPLLAARAATEAPEIARVRDAPASRYAVVPMRAEAPGGTRTPARPLRRRGGPGMRAPVSGPRRGAPMMDREGRSE